MSSSSEIHVQEVLNNLSNSVKREVDNIDNFSAVIAQHTAQVAKAQTEAETQAQTSADTLVIEAEDIQNPNQDQVHQDELERIAKEHQQATEAADHTLVESHTRVDQVSVTDDSTIIHVNALDTGNGSTLATVPIASSSPSVPAVTAAKPAPGTPEWHKLRRDNHKEVERRRRETINAGIHDLAQVIPNPDKNKGAILRQAVNFVQSIQENHQKLLADKDALSNAAIERDQAVLAKELAQTQLQALIAEHDQLKRNLETLKKTLDEKEEESKKRQRTE